MVGRRFGHYRVLEQLGQGGMGEVYLAHDTNLDRRVALKFLPDSTEQDDVARKRLAREARSAASVNRMRSRERAYPHLTRGEIELARGNTDAALAAFELAATFDAELSREPLARCRRLRGETEVAIALYEELRADRKLGYEYQNVWIEAHYYLGRLYEEAGDQHEAMEAYAALLEIWREADPDLILAADARERLVRR